MPSKSTLAIVTCLAFGSAVMSLPFVNSESYDLVERDYANTLETRMFEMDIDARDGPTIPTSTVSAPSTVDGRPRHHRKRNKHHGQKTQNVHHNAQPAAATDRAPASAIDSSNGGPGEPPASAEPASAPSADEGSGPLSARDDDLLFDVNGIPSGPDSTPRPFPLPVPPPKPSARAAINRQGHKANVNGKRMYRRQFSGPFRAVKGAHAQRRMGQGPGSGLMRGRKTPHQKYPPKDPKPIVPRPNSPDPDED